MGDVLVQGGKVTDGRITELSIRLHGLGERTIDRDTAVRWMRDGHSLVPVRAGRRSTALQLVEVGDGEWAIRTDNQAVPQDELPSP